MIFYSENYGQTNNIQHNLFVDIDLTDPEIEAAAAKTQSVFKMSGKKNKQYNF
jgi:hypothetical protein